MEDDLGQRMKNYELITNSKIIPHIPTIIRIDGKAFHSYTSKMEKPYCKALHNCFTLASMNVRKEYRYDLVYGQSDEVSFMHYNPNTRTQEFLDGRIQKITSVLTSMFTYWFNLHARFYLFENMDHKIPAYFDCRIFQLPKDEVINYFIWRQQDAVRNSIQMLGQSYFSPKELHKKTCNEIQDMLFNTRQINWNDMPTIFKRGWIIDKTGIKKEIPIFSADREFINNYLNKEITL